MVGKVAKLKSDYARIKNILIKDKCNKNDKLGMIMQSEIYELLSNYMKVEGLNCSISLKSDGKWQVKIIAEANSFYAIKTST